MVNYFHSLLPQYENSKAEYRASVIQKIIWDLGNTDRWKVGHNLLYQFYLNLIND